MSETDCVWHLHLIFADGKSVCRTHIGHGIDRDLALEAEEEAAARRGQTLTRAYWRVCRQDQQHPANWQGEN